MMSFSESQSQSPQTERKFQESSGKDQYSSKINAIWKHIQDTKNIYPSDEETYEMYRNKKVGNRQNDNSLSVEKCQRPKKIIDHIKAKRSKQPSTQLKRKSLNQRYELSPSQQKQSNTQKSKLQSNDLQVKLQKSKQNTNILMKKLIQAEQQIQYLEYQLEKEITEKGQLYQELSKRTERQRYGGDKENRLVDANRLEERQLEAMLLVDKYQLRLRAVERENEQKSRRIALLEGQLRKINTELQQQKHQANEYTLQKTVFKGSQLLQLNQAYKTIERLVALLRSTQEYRQLGNFAQEVKNIHFLTRIPKQIKSELSHVKIASNKKPTCNCTQVKINQRLLWTPLLCYKKMLEMKIKYDTLNEDCIQEVLFEMNRLYLSKEQARVSRLKSCYESEIQKLKKKTQLTYDEILAKKQIERLKKQLQTSKKNNGKSSSRKPHFPSQKVQGNSGFHLKNLRAIGQYEDELKVKERQVKLLTQRIKLLQSQTMSYDKSLYMQGILWVIDKILQQLDVNSQDVRDFETRFRNKMDSALEMEDWIRLFKEFFQAIEEMGHSLVERVLAIKETTIQKMNGVGVS